MKKCLLLFMAFVLLLVIAALSERADEEVKTEIVAR